MQDVYRCKALVKMPQKFNKETRFEYENHDYLATTEKEYNKIRKELHTSHLQRK